MSKLANKLYFKAMTNLSKLWKNERGETNIIAIIIILAIVIALAIVFRGAIEKLFKSIWTGIEGDVNAATSNFAN